MATSAIPHRIPHPPIVSRDQWLAKRRKLLADEKELTKHYDRVNAGRRRLPMVKIEKDYVFDGHHGKPSLKDLFDGRRQLIVYHFMFDPTWDKGCTGCTGLVDALGDLSLLEKRDTTFVVVSRAPLAKLDAYKAQKGWSITWFSSFGSDFIFFQAEDGIRDVVVTGVQTCALPICRGQLRGELDTGQPSRADDVSKTD